MWFYNNFPNLGGIHLNERLLSVPVTAHRLGFVSAGLVPKQTR